MDPALALTRTRIFGGMARADLARLAERMERRRFARGQFLYNEGDPVAGLFVVRTGRAKVFRVDEGGNEIVLKVWMPGETDGEPAIFAPERTYLTHASALVATECLFLARAALVAVLETQPRAMEGMLERLAVLARAQTVHLTRVAFLDISGRVALVLLELADSAGVAVPGGQRIGFPLAQRTIAGLVAATRENVNRVLARFVAEGIVRQDEGFLTVCDSDALRQKTTRR
jgi:CRP/FNR family cyclic AMP-dependent transcriptional regulator